MGEGYVYLVDKMGDDEKVVRSARVSYGKHEEVRGVREDERLIDYLMRNGHTSPFEQVVFTFQVKAPLFVVQQFLRHRTFKFNQESSRYMDLGEEMYVPGVFRNQSSDSKQSSEGEHEDSEELLGEVREYFGVVRGLYERLVGRGVAREQARIVLPSAQYTQFVFTADLHNLLHFLRLRLHHHAQAEMTEYAQKILELIRDVVPVSVDAWERHIRFGTSFTDAELMMLFRGLGLDDEQGVMDSIAKRTGLSSYDRDFRILVQKLDGPIKRIGKEGMK